MRTLTLLLVSAMWWTGASLIPAPASAQVVDALGLGLGHVESRQVRARDDDSRTRSGLSVSAFAEVLTPKPSLAVSTRLAFTPRGGGYELPGAGGAPATTADVRADYLTLAVLPTLRLGAGPVRLIALVGPSLDMHVRGGAPADLSATFRDPAPQVLTGILGVGVEIRGPRRTFVAVEARHEEGLGGAFRSAPEQIRHRSRVIAVRLGYRPLR